MNNLEKINDFFTNNKENLLILNKMNEEVNCLYHSFINHYGEKNQVKIEFKNELKIDNQINDLFNLDKIYITSTGNKKEIQKFSTMSSKVIIFTEYKNFKIFQKEYLSINTYNYINDIKIFIKEKLGIDNTILFENIIDNPHFFYSEISKYLINKENYSKNSVSNSDKNLILNIRKDIFDIKKNGKLKELFFKLKEEVKYKKLSFLTY